MPKLPEQIKTVPEEREAYAPYNFVPLPERVVLAETPLPDQDRYHPDRFTGRIECVLTTASPLYVRCGWSPEDFAAHGSTAFHDLTPEQQRERAKFFAYADPEAPVIPGSSLRGMLRALVEIASYGKMGRVTERPRFFYRAVAANKNTDDPLAIPYKTKLAKVKAGYLVHRDNGWAIIPAEPLGAEGYFKVRERDLPDSLGVHAFDDPEYQPQYIEVSFTTRQTKDKKLAIDRVDKPGIHNHQGMLVSSGNMKETGSDDQSSPRKRHAIIGQRKRGVQFIPIDKQAIEDYCAGLTPFQKGEKQEDSPFDRRLGVLKDGRPIFYVEPERGMPVVLFGQSPNFRIPYRFPGSSRASSPRDFVPTHLRHAHETDIAEAIFGYALSGDDAKENKAADAPRPVAGAGRVFVSDAELEGTPTQLWADQEHEIVTPKILSGPKPTTFQHYLVQDQASKSGLHHYASQPGEDTVLRGHKLYWHKPKAVLADMIERDQRKIAQAESQYTRIKPVAPGINFRFTLRFENLSQVELGALLWVLRLAADERYRLALGMGKPLGMGAVSITHTVYRDDRQARYNHLFDQNQWHSADQTMTEDEIEACVRQFETYVLQYAQEKVERLEATLRISCLRALLSWNEAPPAKKTRYLEIERPAGTHIRAARPAKPYSKTVNEYGERPVLPLPCQIIGWDCDPTTEPTATSEVPAATAPTQSVAPPPTIQAPSQPVATDAPLPPPVVLKKLEIDVEITGQCKGELRLSGFGRGIKVQLNLREFEVPKNKDVVGFIRWKDAPGKISGGFRGIIEEDFESDGKTRYLILKPKARN
ncbi:MAG: TIGR03986 family CRISPR-associated RAMP protein [Oscillochloridaceae bacterium umkhey_bin13]